MEFGTLTEGAQWFLGHGYALMFIAMLIEGPVVTAAGAFGATLGYFNLYTVFLLSVLGNLIPDIILYVVGFFGRQHLLDRYSRQLDRYFGLTKERILRIENLFENHAGKTLLAIKLMPFLATPGLIIAGATRMQIKKYTWLSLLIILPTSLFFLALGYYFGAAYATIRHYVKYGEYAIAAFIVLAIAISYFYKKFEKRISERIEKI
jgi:membrane protein DedA with SNARE-associated domain